MKRGKKWVEAPARTTIPAGVAHRIEFGDSIAHEYYDGTSWDTSGFRTPLSSVKTYLDAKQFPPTAAEYRERYLLAQRLTDEAWDAYQADPTNLQAYVDCCRLGLEIGKYRKAYLERCNSQKEKA